MPVFVDSWRGCGTDCVRRLGVQSELGVARETEMTNGKWLSLSRRIFLLLFLIILSLYSRIETMLLRKFERRMKRPNEWQISYLKPCCCYAPFGLLPAKLSASRPVCSRLRYVWGSLNYVHQSLDLSALSMVAGECRFNVIPFEDSEVSGTVVSQLTKIYDTCPFPQSLEQICPGVPVSMYTRTQWLQ